MLKEGIVIWGISLQMSLKRYNESVKNKAVLTRFFVYYIGDIPLLISLSLYLIQSLFIKNELYFCSVFFGVICIKFLVLTNDKPTGSSSAILSASY